MSDQEELVSPRKIKKLDVDVSAKNSRQKLFSLDTQSQDSRATSTPSRRNDSRRFSISTDISSIVGPSYRSLDSPESLNCSSHVDKSSNGTLLQSVVLDESTLRESDTCSLLQPSRKKHFKGKAWRFLKPKLEGTLYYKVLSEFDTIEDIVFQLLNRYQTNEREVTLDMIKFLVDLCGYQSVDVDKYLDFDRKFSYSCEKLVKLLEFDLVDSEILENNTFVFHEASKKLSKMGATMFAAINKFLEEFFVRAHRSELLFAKFIHQHIFVFIFQMCQSNLKSIRVTAIVLIRCILKILNSIFTEEILTEKEQKYIKKYFQYFFTLFRKNSLINDAHLSVLKPENVKHLGIWMTQLPDIYFDNSFEILQLLILDESGDVRLAVLNVFGNLIPSENVRTLIIKRMPVLLDMIKCRLKDINLKVVAKAVEVYTILLEGYHPFISNKDMYFIQELVFSKSYLIAKAAAYFHLCFHTIFTSDEDYRLESSLKICMAPKVVQLKPLMIEAMSEFDTIFQNYDSLFDHLVKFCQKGKIDLANCLAECIHHSVYQQLKGQCSILREHSIQRVPGDAEKIKTSMSFLKSLERFFDTSYDHTHVFNYLIKTLCLIDYAALPSKYTKRNMKIIEYCLDLFLNFNNEELLKNICHFFHYLNTENSNESKDSIENLLNVLFQDMSDTLKKHYEADDTLSQEKLSRHFVKIGVLFAEFKLNNYFDWNLLYTRDGGSIHCEGQIVACEHFILWGIRDLVQLCKDGGNEREISMKSIFLKTVYSEFTLSLVGILNSKSSNKNLKIESVKSLCTMHTSSEEILLNEKAHALAEFRFFLMENLQKEICNDIVKFLKTHVFKKEAVSIEKRRTCITVWLNLILNGLVDVLYLTYLFENYFKYEEEYGKLIEFAAKQIHEAKPHTFFNIILATLTQVAEEELKTKKQDISQEIDLIMLAEKLASLPQFSNSPENVFLMIQFGLKFVFYKKIYGFLVVLQIFLPKLNKELLVKCQQLFLKTIPSNMENQREVEYFKSKLSGIKSGAQIKGLDSTSTNSTTKNKKTPSRNVRKSSGGNKTTPRKTPKQKTTKTTPKNLKELRNRKINSL